MQKKISSFLMNKFKGVSVCTLFIFSLFSVSANAQTDSTDLDLYMSDAVLETALDSILFSGETYEQLNLDFTVSDTVTFSKIHLELFNASSDLLVFKKMYTISELELESLITAWDVTIPFGNLENTNTYLVAIIVEQYDGSLSATITKTLNP